MPNETSGPNLTPENMHRTHLLWQDEGYLIWLARQEAADESDRITENLLRLSDQLRQERESRLAAEKQPTDFHAIFERNVSKSKRTPTELQLKEWNDKWEAALREVEQSHTNLTSAIRKRFGKLVPIIEDGRVIGVQDPNERQEDSKEVRKGTPSRHVHESKTSPSRKLRNPPKPGRGGDKDAPAHETHIDGERIIR